MTATNKKNDQRKSQENASEIQKRRKQKKFLSRKEIFLIERTCLLILSIKVNESKVY